MIKLITCDIDGTLLHNYSDPVSESMFGLIKKFKEKGVLFVAASGRNLSNLKKIFEPVKNDIGYISENGALITYNENTIYKSVLDNNLAKKLALKILEDPNFELQVCCINTIYLIPKTERFLEFNKTSIANNISIVKTLEEIKEDILKVTIYEEKEIPLELVKPFIEEFGDKFHHVSSGSSWYDFMNQNTHKGSAIEILQKELNISKDETVAFGDNFNDIEMLKDAKYSYAMEKAHSDVKKYAKYTSSCVETSLNELYNNFFG